jgi:hypothetical protein
MQQEMSSEQRACPYCGTSLAADQRTCPNPNCGLPYPFDDEPSPPPGAPDTLATPNRPAPGSNADNPLARFKTVFILAGVLILIIAVGYGLFRVGVSYLESGRPDPAAAATSTAGPVVVPPPFAGAPGASPSPAPGQPGAGPSPSPSPAAAGPRLKVTNTEGQGANMRQRPSTTAPVLRSLPEGATVEAIGSETNAEGRAWRNVRDQGGATGWVAAELLVPE